MLTCYIITENFCGIHIFPRKGVWRCHLYLTAYEKEAVHGIFRRKNIIAVMKPVPVYIKQLLALSNWNR